MSGAPTPFRLTAGGYFRAECGVKVGPMIDEGDGTFVTEMEGVAPNGRLWTDFLWESDGQRYFEEDRGQGTDLIAPWTEADDAAPAEADDDGWIAWGGGECPVPGDTLVEIRFRDVTILGVFWAANLRWSHCSLSADIIAYRVVEKAPEPKDASWVDPREPARVEALNHLTSAAIEGALSLAARDAALHGTGAAIVRADGSAEHIDQAELRPEPDTRPPVQPVAGMYAELRGGKVMDSPLERSGSLRYPWRLQAHHFHFSWTDDGRYDVDELPHRLDIVALHKAPPGERLREAAASTDEVLLERARGFLDGYEAAAKSVRACQIRISEPFDSSFDKMKGIVSEMLEHSVAAMRKQLSSDPAAAIETTRAALGLGANQAAPAPPAPSQVDEAAGRFNRDYPRSVWLERDEETNEKRWFSIRGMGVEYIRADTADAALASISRGEAVASQAVLDVLAERRRQIEVEGWTTGHDDLHRDGEMACAAACYALPEAYRGELGRHTFVGPRPKLWPWSASWWKPKDRRSDLVKACALIIAEIERLDRAAARRETSNV